MIPQAFPTDTPLPTIDGIRSRVKFLSGFSPELYDCCTNSCVCYVGPHANLDRCPYCKADRFGANKKPQKRFAYIPLIPRLAAFVANPTIASKLEYRHTYQSEDSKIKDVFDSQIYHRLQKRQIHINDQKLSRRYFSDGRDIALGLSTDGFCPFKRRNQTAWPLIVFLYNLPPEIRFHLENILSLGVIPGPKKPHDIDSFLWPLVQELLTLKKGVPAFDALSQTRFALHAFLILIFGDMPAMSLIMSMKGHNGISPCRMCKILGLRVPGSRATTHYVPLDRTNHPDAGANKIYNAAALPLRTHSEMLAQATEIENAQTNTAADALAKEYGIKGRSILFHIDSIFFPASFPFDFMHLIWENVIKNLLLLWTGDFKDMDEGSGSYWLADAIWDGIGLSTAAAGRTIPSAYGARVPNIAQSSNLSAEMYSIWTLYIAPVLLRRRFRHKKYYDHFVELVYLLNLCLQFEITLAEVEMVRLGFIDWVKKYERYVKKYWA